MATTKPALVLVTGSWHIPATYSKLTDALRSSGYEVHVPRLPTTNQVRPPNGDLASDTTLIRGYVESLVEAGRTVVVIMHSYGGQVGTNTLCGLGLDKRTQHQDRPTGGVTHLIYLCAFALPEGGSMIGKVREFGHEHLMPVAFDFAEDDSCVDRDPKTLLVGPVVDDAEAEKYISNLVRWNGKAMYQEVTQCAWREIPVAYIYTTQDMTVPYDYQKSMVEKMRVDGREVWTFELATSHCPNLKMTEEVVDFVNQVGGGQTA